MLSVPARTHASLSAEVPRTHRAEIQALFPDLDLTGLFIVPTCQRAELDLVCTGPEVEEEKDRLLERFAAWAERVCKSLASCGHWADYIDPCSGLPMMHRQYQRPYSEVDGFCTLLKYPVANAGCCKIILHPKWGSKFYPATLFARAPLDVLQQAITSAEF